jgi:hypothetical protein
MAKHYKIFGYMTAVRNGGISPYDILHWIQKNVTPSWNIQDRVMEVVQTLPKTGTW